LNGCALTGRFWREAVVRQDAGLSKNQERAFSRESDYLLGKQVKHNGGR